MSTRDVNQMLYGQLAADATLLGLGMTGVFSFQAPESQALPLVIFQKQDGTHSYTLPQHNWVDHRYVVKGVSSEVEDLAQQVDNRIFAILNRQKPPLASGRIMLMERVGDIAYAERVGGTTFYHVGGTYKIVVADV